MLTMLRACQPSWDIFTMFYSIPLSGLPSPPGSAAFAEGVKSRILSLGNASVIYLSKVNIYIAQDLPQFRTFRLNATQSCDSHS